MNRLRSSVSLTFLVAASFVAAAPAQEGPDVTENLASKFRWRELGPSNMGGRIVELAVYEKDPTTWWAATASGGLLKTTNNGITLEHQFDKEAVVSIGSVSVAQSNPNIVWVGTGEENPRNSVSYGDGVYKSVDGGKTWKNMGLRKTFQIGCVQVHPTNPDIVYVGALGRLYGPNEERGLYKTTDGGETWKKIHYVDEHTGVIDIQLKPGDPDTLIFATYERMRDGFDGNSPVKRIAPGSALWRSTDGGRTIQKLKKGLPTNNFGRVGIDFFRKDPNVVFAIIETEMMGKPGANVGYSGIDTVQDGKSGVKITAVANNGPASKAGLKTGDVITRVNTTDIKTGPQLLKTICNQDVDDVIVVGYMRDGESKEVNVTLTKRPTRSSRGRGFRGFGRGRRGGSTGGRVTNMNPTFSGRLNGQGANLQHYQGKKGFEHGGIFRSDDCGSSWYRVNSIDPRPMYFSQFRVDPTDTKYQYVLGISGSRSKDGGETFTSDFTRGVHADHHALWINPSNPKHMILGCDGGIYQTYDRGNVWDHFNHVAIGQFYHATVGPRRDYNVYGGLQDNGSWGGPHRGGINEDWFRIGGGDGFIVRVDRNDPDQLYMESQNGATQRRNLKTGAGGRISPARSRSQRGGQQRGGQQRGGQRSTRRYRYNWETPFILSHHNSRIYYNAGNYVFRSLDRGNNLRPISPKITNTDRGSATALAESPVNPDVLYVGTDDGALWGTTDGGRTWNDLRKAKATGSDGDSELVPFTSIVKKPMWISSISASRHAEGRVFVTVDAHRSNDDAPYVLMSDDFGKSWKDLRANLPARGSTRAVREDRVNQNLLYLGTEFGFYISLSQGEWWIRFHNNLPTVSIHDIAQHESCGDIVLATHGRSLWATDVTMLRQLTKKSLEKDVVVYNPAEVVRFPRGRSRGSSAGARRFVGDAPASQPEIFFYLAKDAKDLKVTIHDQTGRKLRDLSVDRYKSAGLHKVVWDGRSNPRTRSGGNRQMTREEMMRMYRMRNRGGSTGTFRVVVNADGETAETTFKISAAPQEDK